MHVKSDEDLVETKVKGKLTISCIIIELLRRNYKVRGRLMKDCVVKEG